MNTKLFNAVVDYCKRLPVETVSLNQMDGWEYETNQSFEPEYFLDEEHNFTISFKVYVSYWTTTSDEEWGYDTEIKDAKVDYWDFEIYDEENHEYVTLTKQQQEILKEIMTPLLIIE